MAPNAQVSDYEYSSEDPLNREPEVKELISSFITTTGGYHRNHGPIPHLDRDSHHVSVKGAVVNELSLSISDLATSFPQHEVVCALQCAGNRRHTMRTLLKEVDGLDWGDAAVMNCSWKGPRLRDVLLRAQPTIEGKAHVAFACYSTKVQDDDWYGGSIELERGLSSDAEVILALEMNSEPLPVDHGAPVRIIAPGVAGARSVKWLEAITVQSSESANFYQSRDYKILPPEATDKASAEMFWDSTPALQDMPINSVIGYPQSGEQVRPDNNGLIDIRGYALPQAAEGPIVKVEVSVDDGGTWQDAELVGECGKWSWALWKAKVRLERGKGRRILSRATDKGGNVQNGDSQWNFKGVAYNGFGEVREVDVL